MNQYRNSDGEQVMDLSPATYEWTVQDATPPTTEFLGATEIGPPQFLEPGLRFSFRGDDDLASSFELEFECAFDNTADGPPPVWEECGEPGPNDTFFHDIAFADLTAGPYTFQVRALDVAGNADQTPAPAPAYEFAVEAEPETTIASVTPDMGLDLQTDSHDRDLHLLRHGRLLRVRARLGDLHALREPGDVHDVPYGTHLFRVQAVAEFGTRDQTPAEFEWESGFLTRARRDDHERAAATGTTSTTATFEFASTDPDSDVPVHPRRRRAAARAVAERRRTRTSWPAANRTPSRSWRRSRTCSSKACPRSTEWTITDDARRDGPARAAAGRPERRTRSTFTFTGRTTGR